MKVAIDTGPLTSGDSVRGIGFYTSALIDGLLKLQKKNNFSIDLVNGFSSDLSKYDLIHYPHFKLYSTVIPILDGIKVVVTIHDVIPLLFPRHYPSGMRGKLRLNKQIKSLKSIDAIITDSETSKKDIVRYLRVPEEKIFVVYLAQRNIFREISNHQLLSKTQKKFNLPRKFVLYVGDVNYNKNIPALVSACEKSGLKLVIVGKHAKSVDDFGLRLQSLEGPRDWIRYMFGKDHPEIVHYDLLDTQFNSKNIIRLGFVTEDELVAIYNLASIYCQPSLAEGFGLPVLEAMVCGTPVVASKSQALVEISEGSALFVDPSTDCLSEALKKLFDNKKIRDEYSELGKIHVKKFSWLKTAEKTLGVYRIISEK